MVTRKTSADKPSRVLQLRIDLAHVKPPIWRRVLVPESITLKKLHDVIQVSMGWMDCHLHEFEIGGIRYGTPDPEFDFGEPVLSEARTTLGKALGGLKTIRYEYDFGDGWEHKIKVEKVLPGDGFPGVLCVAGARACPPEDCGGPWGYAEFLEAIADPDHSEHENMAEWFDGDFDPEGFDMNEVNKGLAGIKA